MKIKLSNPERFLSEQYYVFYQTLKNHELQVKSLRQTAARTPKAAARLNAIIAAKEHNLQLIGAIVQALKLRADMDMVLEDVVLSQQGSSEIWRGQNNTHAYLKDFRYLNRDWCALPEAEAQVLQIIEALKERTAEYSPDQQAILFLGAGLGRIAFEHNDLFQQVYALDKSFSMVYHFNHLLENDLDFYEINEFNVLKPEFSTRKLTASIRNASKEALAHKDRFEYFVGDAMELPFEAEALSCITSVYFTDVIALQLYFAELQRVLKPGGLFIHFGPLDYFFSDRGEMLSAEEFKDEFEANGFETLHESTMDLPHMPSSLLMTQKIYTNWFYIARKINKKAKTRFDSGLIYEINQPIYLQNKTQFGETQLATTELISKDGAVFEGAESILPLLAMIDGKATLESIMQEVVLKFNLDETEQLKLLKIFETLFDKGIIKMAL